jgi:acid stress-induced BolA-like protein IbaG/YrbA
VEIADIEKLLNDSLSLDELHVTFDGSHSSVIAVSDIFEGMSRVKKQQTVYAPLAEVINEGKIHAVSIKTFTNAQWQKEKVFNQPG